MEQQDEFSVAEAVAVQRALRQTLGLPGETFPLPAFVGMISDEIEQMRRNGHDDAAIVEVIYATTGRTIDPAVLARFYAPPEARRRPGG